MTIEEIEKLIDEFDRAVNNLAHEVSRAARAGDNADWYLAATQKYNMARETLIEAIKQYGRIIFIKDRVHEQGEPAELEEETEPSDDERDHIISLLSKRYGELEEFRRSILDEDWLEKKMLCFLVRFNLLSPHSPPLTHPTCSNGKCPFCFPPAKPETDHTPDGRKTAQQESLVQRTIREMQPEPTAKDASKKAVDEIMGMVNDHLEKLREKVTVDQIISVVGEIKNKWYWYGKRPSEYPLDDGPLWKELEQKLEYLVSLQEK